MLNRSALDNIRYGKPDATEAEVIAAATKAEAHEFIKDMQDHTGRKGYAAHLGERGVKLSGGQRQRIAIARAIVLKPKFIVLDEPTSALDMSVQAQIVDLLTDLQRKHKLAYMFISHDLKVVRALADHVIVMKDGKVVEQGPADDIFDNPAEPYTKALMAAAFNLEFDEQAVASGVVSV